MWKKKDPISGFEQITGWSLDALSLLRHDRLSLTEKQWQLNEVFFIRNLTRYLTQNSHRYFR